VISKLATSEHEPSDTAAEMVAMPGVVHVRVVMAAAGASNVPEVVVHAKVTTSAGSGSVGRTAECVHL
jgi:hypothetical protein